MLHKALDQLCRERIKATLLALVRGEAQAMFSTNPSLIGAIHTARKDEEE